MKKRIVSILLALTLCLSMSLSALAATVTFDGNGGTYQNNETYTVSSDTEVSFALPVFERDGYTLAGWSADKDSAEATYTADSTYTLNADSTLYAIWQENDTGDVEFTRAELAVLIYNKFQPEDKGVDAGFTDITDCTDEQKTAINALAAAGIISGTAEGTFDPDGPVTRAAVAKIIWTLTGSDESAETQTIFNDIESGAWYEIMINSLVAQGILTSADATDGKFAPTDNASETVVTTWLGRITDTDDGNTGDTGDTGDYDDGYTGGSTGGSSGATDTTTDTTTETTENEDGSVTETTTKAETTETENEDGSVTVTETTATESVTTAADGAQSKQTVETVTETVTAADGSQTVSVTTTTGMETADGSTSTTVDVNGVITAEVTLSEAAVSENRVTLPMPAVSTTTDSDAAATITINTGSEEDVKVVVPVTGITTGTVAVIVHEDGTEEVIRASATGEDGLVFTIPDGATVKVVDNSTDFDDIDDNAWYGDAADFVSSRELFGGISDTEDVFAPGLTMTRGMLAVVLHRLEYEAGHSFAGGFDDIPDGQWYTDSVLWAAEKGIVTGYGDGSFGAEDSINREQLAVMLWRYAGKPESSHDISGFTDAGDISEYSKQALAWANEHGIINGYGNGQLGARDGAARAQVAQMLMNFVNAINK